MPYDVTGQPHFCQENKETNVDLGLKVCSVCGKPVFAMKSKIIDYSTLTEHLCKKGDVTRYQKYLDKTKTGKKK